jgi:hypothetical protein
MPQSGYNRPNPIATVLFFVFLSAVLLQWVFTLLREPMGSRSLINTESKSKTVKLTKLANDHISGEEQSDEVRIRAHAVLWLE